MGDPLDTDDPVLEAQLSRTESLRAAAHTFSPVHEVLFVTVVCMAQFMTQAALSTCLSPLDIIGDSFDIGNPGILSWLIAGYSLTVGTFILFFGRCGDLFGYRVMMIIGFSWFAIWSMVAGVSVYSNYILFIFARALQGLGPAMLFPNALAVLGATYPPGNKKRLIFALFGGNAPSGAVVGGVFAALFSQLSWWPWSFWCTAIYCLILAVLVYLVVPPTPSHTQGMRFWTLVSELDVAGAALGITGLVLVNIAWNQAPVVGWQEAYVYVLLIIGFIFLAVFIYYESKISKHPLIPFETLNADVSFILGCVSCGWASFGIWIYYAWRFLENIRGNSPLLTAAQFVPVSPSGLLASFATAYLMVKVRPGWIMLVALSAFTLGSVLMTINPVHETYWALTFVSLLVMPWGMDMSFPAATVILSDAVGRRNQGMAASLVTTAVNYSISIGLGIAGTVEVHVNNGGLTFEDKRKGYHGAQYMGIGIGGLATMFSQIMRNLGHNPFRGQPSHVMSNAARIGLACQASKPRATAPEARPPQPPRPKGNFVPAATTPPIPRILAEYSQWVVDSIPSMEVSRPEKGIATYTLSPNRQRLFPNFWHTAIFNTFRRFRHQVLYVAPPFIVAYSLMNWATEENEFLNSKAGREGGHE
ncbi:Drug resistance protein [Talaromyces atroroseus]|uniref:Cytochrome b-c1 complex subunit 8 n=1 Tax=Talaromyces atroroseus TaxID=1441469 RepID=A0A225ATK4_TALAT|nr:Drug resistance protein [Talaromyces atroroseus]OKL58266.1 Drug resistance protein [Talaromyces atroroseus]